MDRNDALDLIRTEIKNENLVKHMLAVEAIMKELAARYDADVDTWALAGLLHDIDLGRTNGDMAVHGDVGSKILKEQGWPEEIVYSVLAHAGKAPCLSVMDKALYAVDPLTGLIVASALIHPDRRLASIDAEFVINRFKEKGFARGARRDAISTCVDIGLDLQSFCEIGLRAMTDIAADLGL